MKSRFFLVSIITALTAASFAQSVQAQERAPGARFKFAANTWKIEQARLPGEADGPRQVKQGAMPRSASFLGVDPGYLSRPAAPPPQVATRPAMPQVSAKAFVPNTSFMPSFGQPIQPLQAGSPIAMAPSMPQAPHMAAPSQAKPAAPAHTTKRSAPARHYAKSVSAKLKTPTRTTGQSASPATYGNNVGYVPGGFVPVQGGHNVNTDVHGRIIRH